MNEKDNKSLGGYVTSPNIFIKKTMQPDPDGILSEVIFGPLSSYKCSCGILKSKVLDGGKVCKKCNVLCESNTLRSKTIGKIKLIFPVIKFTKKNEFRKLLKRQNLQLLDPIQADAALALSRYLIYKNDKSEISIINDLITTPIGWTAIPFRITGIYSFVLILKYMATKLNIGAAKFFFDQKYIINEMSVLPPDVRPIIRDPKNPKEIIRVEVNDYYISILNLNKRNILLDPVIVSDETSWFDKIDINLSDPNLMLEEIVEPVVLEYDRITALYNYYSDEIYKWALKTIGGKKGLIRSSILGRTIEFSARSVVTTNPKLKPYQIEISKKILWKLWQPYFLNWLCVETEKMPFDEAFYNVCMKEYEDNKILFNEFLESFCKK